MTTAVCMREEDFKLLYFVRKRTHAESFTDSIREAIRIAAETLTGT